ncbi:hypothetical protein HDU67_002933 [Dinochytrium kinnereticum]|nr:hypothetical protein HDU67_002933 [Dinochytrium kinnereticum]
MRRGRSISSKYPGKHVAVRLGLEKIQELDQILKQKLEVEMAVKSSSTSRSGTGMKAHHHEHVSHDFDEEIETKSVHSADSNTFVTEPPWIRRKRLLSKPSSSTQKEVEHLKGYGKGNFIQRNIALGPNARYYDAMTEEEELRVDRLLRDDAKDEEEEEENAIQTQTISSTLSREDHLKLDEIDSILSSRVEFDSRAISLDPTVALKLKQIDEELERLRHDDTRIATPQDIQR